MAMSILQCGVKVIASDRMRYTDSNRELALLTTDQGDLMDFENRQREHTLRSVLSWDHTRKLESIGKGSVVHTWLARNDHKRDWEMVDNG